MEATPICIAVYDGTRLEHSYTISALPVPPDMALHEDNRGATAAVARRMGEDEARRTAKRCNGCSKKGPGAFVVDVLLGRPQPDAVAVGVVAVCASGGRCAAAASELLRAMATGGGRSLPAPENGRQPLDIELLICASWPEGSSDPTFEERAVRRRKEVPAEILHPVGFDTTRAFDSMEELAKTEGEVLFVARRPRCLGCGRASQGFFVLNSLDRGTWPWTFRSYMFPVCGPCDPVFMRRGQTWQKKANREGGVRPYQLVCCDAKCGASSADPACAATFRRCSRCKGVSYCSKECKRKDWTEHKKVCVPPVDQAGSKDRV
ncbi:hypothetical protein DFJ74DRAFT_764632 [Hyaloraphidium curvatum]|nr:hypothetical protein DFJ74DRAFT_764632 [Hyaloraphidium curvatum]